MHLHYLTLERQAAFLAARLRGSNIRDSFTQRKNEWVITLDVPGSAEPAFLLLGCDGQYPFVLLS
ncbi:MAG TPA: hypothetical protein PLG66_11945, partial [Calditrichia bacterium]|nr:hypothetical protein [Calditrichia bacterium]